MSLKARIEAVIYAAEEPVTLAQLSAIFREEALENRAERMAAEEAARAEAERATQPEDSEPTPSESPVAAEGEAVPTEDGLAPAEEHASEDSEAAAAAVESASVGPEPASTTEAADTMPDAAPPESSPETSETAPGDGVASAASSEEDEKRAARQRDREVRDEVRRVVDELMADYAASERGLEIREVAGGFRMATRAEYHDAVRAFVKSLKPPMKLSLQALETLAVIAYKQPITAPEIGEIRGVDSGGVLGSLVARKLITTEGRKQVIGRPILYKTTREFLLRFGLKDLNELPSIEEFEKMASELAEQEAAAEEPASEAELPFAQNESPEEESAAEGTPASDKIAGEAADGVTEALDDETAPVEEQS